MQSVSSRIWTRVAVFISYDDNDYTTNQNVNVFIQKLYKIYKGSPRGVMVKVMDCGIIGSEFQFQSRYDVHFRVNTRGKGMNFLILPAMG